MCTCRIYSVVCGIYAYNKYIVVEVVGVTKRIEKLEIINLKWSQRQQQKNIFFHLYLPLIADFRREQVSNTARPKTRASASK